MALDAKTLAQRYTPKQLKVLPLDRQMCMVRFSPDGKVLAAGGTDGTVRRWDASTDQFAELPKLTGHNGWVQTLAFHPDGKRLVTADSWGQVHCWSYADKAAKPLWSINPAHDGWIRALAVSPDGQGVATCGFDQRVCLWSAADGKKQQELLGHGIDTYALAFHPAGKALVSGDLKGIVKQWDLATGKSVRDLDAKIMYLFDRLQDVGGVRCFAFDAKGTTLVCGGMTPKSGGFVQGAPVLLVFDWLTGKLKYTLKPGTDNDGYVFDVHCHPEGFLMAVTSGQPGVGKFFFQRPEDAQPFFTTALANSHSLGVHPNGTRLAALSTNGGSNGNGRNLDKNKEYPGNFSPVHIWDLPKAGT